MISTRSNRRPALMLRPWLRGALYDTLTRTAVLHLDAYVKEDEASLKYLDLYWSEGGRRPVARDVYRIALDGLYPTTLPACVLTAVHWSRANDAWMRRLHVSVVERAADVERTGRWARVSMLAHYVVVKDTNVETFKNAYTDPKPYAPRKPKPKPGALPDLL